MSLPLVILIFFISLKKIVYSVDLYVYYSKFDTLFYYCFFYQSSSLFNPTNQLIFYFGQNQTNKQITKSKCQFHKIYSLFCRLLLLSQTMNHHRKISKTYTMFTAYNFLNEPRNLLTVAINNQMSIFARFSTLSFNFFFLVFLFLFRFFASRSLFWFRFPFVSITLTSQNSNTQFSSYTKYELSPVYFFSSHLLRRKKKEIYWQVSARYGKKWWLN